MKRYGLTFFALSYAGQPLTPSHKVPDPVPEIVHSKSLSSDGPNIVPSYANQQKAAEEAEQAKQEASAAADKVAKDARICSLNR
ncbi:Hypothetical protein R9X50_00104400 [Acrodontium crateriforme]|uniref:Uncharacterized protein n=1 Tax=Acrodontium crateriforme TaxID=150365 RepID=A0AAQ3LYB3_9PEZI|nr:Hypothetical protein R9X50_00104400 [Acrodontium crateriforme]